MRVYPEGLYKCPKCGVFVTGKDNIEYIDFSSSIDIHWKCDNCSSEWYDEVQVVERHV